MPFYMLKDVIFARMHGNLLFVIMLLLIGCGSKPHVQFVEVSADESKVSFSNSVTPSEKFNMYTYRNFYNGGGVGLGDINNDGLLDIFFCGNMVSNKLYLNKGGFKLEDITVQSGLLTKDLWSTGVSIVDINADGWLDIYVCRSGKPGGARRHNELFINNKNLTFTEKAHDYGLDFEGLSTHAVFFDMDNDSDLDCYLLTNSIRSVGAFDLKKDQRNEPDKNGEGNKLLMNKGEKFVDVSQQAGIYSSRIGFGLGVTIGDFNKDGWQDIYVSNDFFERDYLYVNQKNGTFLESAEHEVKSMSLGSMGADCADVNNDSFPDLFVTEMLPQTNERLKTKATFEDWNHHQARVDNGYYYQYPRNVLQINNGDGTFSEVGRLANVEATDWSWGALIFDVDNDGLKDIFVANGIFKDLLDQDYVNFMATPENVRSILSKEHSVIERLMDMIPSTPISNFAFQNKDGLKFEDKAAIWGLGEPCFSNGSAYGDLDNDGDLDLVINNVNGKARIYKNQNELINPGNHFLKFVLKGNGLNTFALGTKITVEAGDQKFYLEQMPMRGFESSVDPRPNFGVGKFDKIDRVIVEWPNGKTQELKSVKTNQIIELKRNEESNRKIE
jgi:enediyne biosynthesis protein E4